MDQRSGPVGGSLMGTEHLSEFEQSTCMVEEGFCCGFINDELVGPFWVEDGLKINSQTFCQFIEDTFFKQ